MDLMSAKTVDETLGFILTRLKEYDYPGLLAIAPKILQLDSIQPDGLVEEYTETQLRVFLTVIIRTLYAQRPEALRSIDIHC